MIIPFFALSIAYGFSQFTRPYIIIFLCAELLFSLNGFFLRPYGKELVAYPKIVEETKNFGFNELDARLSEILDGRVATLVGQPQYQFLTDLANKNIVKLKSTGARPYPMIIVYDNDMNFIARLWALDRRLIYAGWPILSDRSFSPWPATSGRRFTGSRG